MKKIIFILALLSCPNAFAATLTTNNVPYACSGGSTPQLCNSNITTSGSNTGIGTTSPVQALQVYDGRFQLSSDTNNGSFIITQYSGTTRITSAASSAGGTVAIGREPTAVQGQPSGNYTVEIWSGANGGSAPTVQADANQDFYTNAWSDYSSSSTIVGFSSLAVNQLQTKTVGKTVYVNFNIQGTSNSTTTSFTVPYTINSTFASEFPLASAIDNTTYVNGAFGFAAVSGSTITFYLSGGNPWTSSGYKEIAGQFWYQSQ